MTAGVKIIETFGWHPGEGARRIERHLARMGRSARALDYAWDREAASLAVAEIAAEGPLRCRLTLDSRGAIELATAPLAPQAAPWTVTLAAERLKAGDFWLRHKTTNRALYDRARAQLPDGIDEALFLNEAGHLCEGTITNVFVEAKDTLLTPPLDDGLLPGILREELIERGEAHEATLSPEDLRGAGAVFVGNSLRGLIRARLLPG